MSQNVFSATFDESKNLLNDIFMKPDQEKKVTHESNDESSINNKRNIGILFCSFFFILFSLALAYAGNKYNGYSFIIFGIGLTIFLISWIAFFISPLYLKTTFVAFTCFFVGPVWLLIEVDVLMFFPTIIKKNHLYILAMAILLILAFLIAIVKQRINSIKSLLFKTKESKFNYYFKKIFKLICIITPIIYFVYIVARLIGQIIFNFTFEINLNFIGFFLIFLICNLILIFIDGYIIISPLLFGYYLHKYPEEYRKFEKKTHQQWYGKLYLKFKGLKDNETNK